MEDDEAVSKQSQKEIESKGRLITAPEAEDIRTQVLAARGAKRDAVVSPEKAAELKETLAGTVPMLRPTRIVTEGGNDLYIDPDTDQKRDPTTFERFVESFARQEIMSVDEARQRGDQLKAERDAFEIQKAQAKAAGMKEPSFESSASTVTDVLSAKDDFGRGVVETPLGATLRAVPAYISAIAAEGYFRGLGYDVDEKGIPTNPNDFGLGLRKALDQVGVPEAIKTSPLMALPLPGMAQTVGPTEMDPTGRRIRSDADTGSTIEDTALNVIKNVTTGRTMGDEFLSTPAVRQVMEETYGDPTAAFWAGSFVDIFIPAGPGTSARIASKALSKTGATKAVGSFIDATILAKGVAHEINIAEGLTDAAKTAAKTAVKGKKDIREMAEAIVTAIGKEADASDELSDIAAWQKKIDTRVPRDMVMVTDRVAVPKSIVKKVSAVINTETEKILKAPSISWALEEIGLLDHADALRLVKNKLSKLDPVVRSRIVDDIRSTIALDSTKSLTDQARTLEKLSELQVSFDPKSLSQSWIGRRIKMITNDPTVTADVRSTQKIMTGAATSALRTTQKDLVAFAKSEKSLPKAWDKLIQKTFGKESGSEASAASLWKKIIGETYGGEKAEGLWESLKAEKVVTDGVLDLTKLPTVNEVERMLNVLNSKMGKLARPVDLDQVLLKVVIEEGVRKNLARAGRAEDAVKWGVKFPDDTTFGKNPRLSQAGRSVVAQSPISGGPIKRFVSTADLARDSKILAENGEEFIKIVDSIPVRKRSSDIIQIAKDAARWSTQASKNTAQGLKYGYYAPNVPFLAGRLVSTPIIAAATIGAERALKSGMRLPSTIRGTVGVVSKNGVVYSPAEITKLVDRFGIGTTAVEVERIGSLANDLLDDAARAGSKLPKQALKRLNPANPALRNFWMEMAHKTELTFRQSVFEMALIEGASPARAAELARKSLFDYGAVPDAVRADIGKYLAGAAIQTSLTWEFVQAVVRNPSTISKAAKAHTALNRRIDSEGLYGDKSLKALGIWRTKINDRDALIYGPESPMMQPIENVLGLLYGVDRTAMGAAAIAKAVAGGITFKEGAISVGSKGKSVAKKLADNFVPEVIGAYELLTSNKDLEKTEPGVSSSGDDKLFWEALLIADLTDPSHDNGLWSGVISILDPVIVSPPSDEYRHPTLPDYWIKQPPEGIPHIFFGTDEDGIPLYQAYKPSKRGVANLKSIRKITPATFTKAFGVAASIAMGQDFDPNSFEIRPEPLVVGGVEGVVGGILTGGVEYDRPDEQKKKLSDDLRSVRQGR